MAGEGELCDLTQPEILSKDTLISVITEKCPHLGDVGELDQGALLEVFYKNVAAMPQRKYRQNRRGRQMTLKQVAKDGKKRKYEEMTGTLETGNRHPTGVFQPRSGLVNAFSAPPGDRLKPPPNCVNFDKKVVKLGQTAGKSPNQPSTKTAIKISNSTVIKTETQKLERKTNREASAVNLNDIVINSKQYGNHNNGSSRTEERKEGNPSPAHPSLTLQPEPSPRALKLKRTTASSIEDAMDVAEFLSEQTENTTSENCDKSAPHPAIQPTGQPNQQKTTSKNHGTSPDESNTAEGVAKRFKRIAVQWP